MIVRIEEYSPPFEGHQYTRRITGRSRKRILKLDESCISNPRSEIGNWTVQFEISAFGFEMQDSSNFKFPLLMPQVCCYLPKGEGKASLIPH